MPTIHIEIDGSRPGTEGSHAIGRFDIGAWGHHYTLNSMAPLPPNLHFHCDVRFHEGGEILRSAGGRSFQIEFYGSGNYRDVTISIGGQRGFEVTVVEDGVQLASWQGAVNPAPNLTLSGWLFARQLHHQGMGQGGGPEEFMEES